MKIEFEVADEKVQSLNTNGRTELIRHCKQWSEDIVDEASRIEASRNDGANNEITAAIITEAANYSKRFPIKKKRDWIIKLIQLFAFISSLVSGSLLDTEKFKDSSHVLWFVIVFFIAIATNVYLTFNTEKNG